MSEIETFSLPLVSAWPSRREFPNCLQLGIPPSYRHNSERFMQFNLRFPDIS